MKEQAKRLAPKPETLRELFLRSGNRCAFPSCNRVMIDDDGVFVGQICHIEAAEPGGERFNQSMDNESRRSFENLLLMCYDHHKVTNDVNNYTVGEMQLIKNRHESKFGDVTRKMRDSIADYTDSLEFVPAKNLQCLINAMQWRSSDEATADSIREVNNFGERLKRLPNPTRELLAVAVSRAASTHDDFNRRGSLSISVAELRHVCDLSLEALREHCHLLDKDSLIEEAERTNFQGLEAIVLRNLEFGWDIFPDLKSFCAKTGVPLHRIIVELDFSVLDV
jgi:hypothetical protein